MSDVLALYENGRVRPCAGVGCEVQATLRRLAYGRYLDVCATHAAVIDADPAANPSPRPALRPVERTPMPTPLLLRKQILDYLAEHPVGETGRAIRRELGLDVTDRWVCKALGELAAAGLVDKIGERSATVWRLRATPEQVVEQVVPTVRQVDGDPLPEVPDGLTAPPPGETTPPAASGPLCRHNTGEPCPAGCDHARCRLYPRGCVDDEYSRGPADSRPAAPTPTVAPPSSTSPVDDGAADLSGWRPVVCCRGCRDRVSRQTDDDTPRSGIVEAAELRARIAELEAIVDADNAATQEALDLCDGHGVAPGVRADAIRWLGDQLGQARAQAPRPAEHLVWCPTGRTPPKYRHADRELALAEARRLAQAYPGQSFYVAGLTDLAVAPVIVVHHDLTVAPDPARPAVPPRGEPDPPKHADGCSCPDCDIPF